MNSNRKLNLLKFGQASLILTSLAFPTFIKPVETKANLIFSTKNTRRTNPTHYTTQRWENGNLVTGYTYNHLNGQLDWFSNDPNTTVHRLQPNRNNALVPYTPTPRTTPRTAPTTIVPPVSPEPIPLPAPNTPSSLAQLLRQAGDQVHLQYTNNN